MWISEESIFEIEGSSSSIHLFHEDRERISFKDRHFSLLVFISEIKPE